MKFDKLSFVCIAGYCLCFITINISMNEVVLDRTRRPPLRCRCISRVPTWSLCDKKRQGRSAKRWRDDPDTHNRDTIWQRTAKYRITWRGLAETFVQPRHTTAAQWLWFSRPSIYIYKVHKPYNGRFVIIVLEQVWKWLPVLSTSVDYIALGTLNYRSRGGIPFLGKNELIYHNILQNKRVDVHMCG